MKGEKQNMNKFITKLAKICLGLSMAAGVGVAFGSQKEASSVSAALDPLGGTYSYTVTSSIGTSSSITMGDVTWTYATDNAGYTSYDTGKGMHYGSGSKSISYIQFSTTAFSSFKVTSVSLTGYDAVPDTKLSVKVDNTDLGTEQDFTSSSSTQTVSNSDGGLKGSSLTIKMYRDSLKTKAIYFSGISVDYKPESGGGGSGGGGDEESDTGTIVFGNQTGQYLLNASNLSPVDSLSNTWTATPSWDDGYTESYTNTDGKVQVGAKSSENDKKWITSLTFTVTFAQTYSVTAFSVKTSGFAETNGTATLKVGDSTVGTGSIGSASATTSATDTTKTGTQLTVILAGNPRMRFYLHEISYTIQSVSESTLDHISLSGTYPTTFDQGDTFSHEGMVVTAVYDDESEVIVTGDVEFSGYNMATSGQQTVTVTYDDGTTTVYETYSITVNAVPFITPAKPSTSGYTGQNETLSFTYGNLTSTLGVSSSNTSVVTVGTPSTSAGSGTVQINFVGAGSTTVKFKDGSTELASVSVSVTASSVTITGLPASKSITSGETFNLSSLITVTALGSYSSDVTWESDDDSIVSVTSAGVITGESVGTTDVTVTSDDYPSATMTCSVTVANMISAVFGSGTSDGTTAETNSDNLINNYGYTIDSNIYFPSLTAVYPKADNAIKLGGSSTQGSMTIGLVNGKVNSKNAYITKITVNAMAYGTDSTSITINGTSKTLTSSFSDYDVDVTGTSTTSIAIEASAASKQRFRIQYINVFYANPVELSSVSTSGQTTLFTAGNNWSYGGSLTAHYSDSSSATKTPTSFKFGDSGINPTTAGTTINTSTTLNHDTHNGKYIYVVYTEDEITKWASYQITVNYAAVTSVEIGTHTVEIGLNETYDDYLDPDKVSVTINSQYANQGYEWIVSANTVNDEYAFDESGLLSGDTEGTITLRCRSTADNSKYDELVVTVSGNPTANFAKASTSGYVGKNEVIYFTYGNMDDTDLIEIESGNTSYVTVANDMLADEGEGLVTINFVGVGSTTVTISYDGGSTLASLTITVSADSVSSVSWNASNFDVFSGTTLTSDIDNTWLASYEMASGDEGLLEYGDYTLKLGGTVITLPHTWVAADSGKNLCIEYGGVSSSTVSVTVTQTINAVYAPTTESNTVSWTASEAADLGSQISSEGGTNTGTISTGTYSWNYTRTLTSLKSGSSDNISFQGSTWIQLGSNNAMESIEFSTNEIPGTIKSVSVVVATAGSHVLTIDVGGTKYLEDESLNLYSGTAGAENPNPANCLETGTGSSSGAITITIAPTGTTKKAMVIRSISVTYETSSGQDVNIANSESHKVAQRVAVKFAKAFNAAMDDTENCTTGLSSAWSACSTAYNTFKSEAAALGSAEEAYAKNLIKYATAQYSDDSGEACIERMMKTYEICVQKHGQTAFMSELVSLGAPQVSPLVNIIGENTNSVAIIVIISMVSMTAIGGYFFLRKRKEN